ncbi:MAG TPA: HAD-IIA family hydrolase [Candidatus Limnocylindria bacterium]|jgi:4-nitrophenyl phosphatase
MPTPPASAPRLVIFDLDGVVYRGPEPIPGAAALVSALRAAGVTTRFATNNSTATRGTYAERLRGQGIVVEPDEIVTSTWATIAHLRQHEPGLRRLLAVGADGMLTELRNAGYKATYVGNAAGPEWNGGQLAADYDAVVAGLDPDVTYRTLGIAAAAIRAGARFVATNADLRYPTPGGLMPGAGAIVAALQATTGQQPLVIGKPEPAMFRAILEAAGVAPEDALVIGDNADADVPAARRAGVPVVLVLTGVTDATAAGTLDGDRRPDWVAAGPAEVAVLLGVTVS